MFQFNLNIWHKLSKIYYIPNALFKFLIIKQKILNKSEKETLDIHAYYLLLIEMTDDFKARIKQRYTDNKNWFNILNMLWKKNKTLTLPVILFYIKDNLIYYKDITN